MTAVLGPFLYIEKIYEDAILPKRQTAGAAGYDFHSYVDIIVPAKDRVLISTGIKIKLPAGTFGNMRPRSSLAVKKIDVEAGTIDEDYRGEVFVLLSNASNVDFAVKKGDRIAQMIIMSYLALDVREAKLDMTVRGSGGFGSTGV